MEDDPAQRFMISNRVSIRAVLASDQGVDVQAILAKAGIFDPVAISVRLGEELDLSGGLLGDGITPNVMGILEPDQPDARQAEPASRRPKALTHDSHTQPEPQPPPSVNLPAAFGLKPMAPVRKRSIRSGG